jgi:hypothetical protein
MKQKMALMAAMLVGGLTASSAFAADDRACLQNNRIWGWRAINERTLVVTDLYYRPFLVRLRSGCVGLTNATVALQFNTWTDLGCLRPGDKVSFREPTLGEMSCLVRDVRPYGPGLNERSYAPPFGSSGEDRSGGR